MTLNKKFIYLSFLVVLLAACGGEEANVDQLISEGDTESINKKKTELLNKKKELENEIKAIDSFLQEKTEKKAGALVSIAQVNDTLFKHYIELQGSVDTKQNITIAAEMGGLLTDVYVTEGEEVRKGQRLARIDDGGISQQIEQMKVQEQLAKTTYERQKRLWDQNIGSEIQYLQAKANYEAQKSSINSMQEQLQKSIVTAPFSGVIDEVITEEGNTVNPGASLLFRLVNLDDMYIEVEVPETYISSIDNGTDVKVEFPVLGESIDSRVRQSSAFINPANRSFKVTIPVNKGNKNIKPNLTARLKINDYTQKNAILIPLAVINENQEGRQYVMVATSIQEGEEYTTAIAKTRTIQTGKTSNNMVEVKEGLEKGDVIIVEGARSVKDEQEVRIKA